MDKETINIVAHRCAAELVEQGGKSGGATYLLAAHDEHVVRLTRELDHEPTLRELFFFGKLIRANLDDDGDGGDARATIAKL